MTDALSSCFCLKLFITLLGSTEELLLAFVCFIYMYVAFLCLLGSTEEYGAMVKKVKLLYPHTTLVAVGFSMGGNLVCKYLGEKEENRRDFVCGVSCCQGYDITRYVMSLLTILLS